MIIPEHFHTRWLAYESSPVDWCEDNYTVSPHVAEFTNTLSNALMVVVPLISLRLGLWDSYVTHISSSPLILLPLQVCIAIGSCLFHGTLSLMGQFLDEMPIVWGLLLLYVIGTPQRYLPKWISQSDLNVFLLIFGLFISGIWIENAHLVAFFLWLISVPIVSFIMVEWYKNSYPEIRKVCNLTFVGFFVVLIIWMVDKFHCETVKSYGLPGIHNIFHVMVGFHANNASALLGFWKAKEKAPSDVDVSFRFAYWVIPYVLCQKKIKT